ncbi:uncharacterized protein LOC143146698 isoform X2 [Ptiloglossa arizonensis]|uniref:uncharacterized protein LOC143146698 isoform X2 n=1 Tax=Ptiloglossa arizonensis TaxID=3350558 RepID=UPI003FA0B910
MELNREKISSLQEEDLRESLNVLSHLSLKPEAHLQSLGFTINNRKVKTHWIPFKLHRLHLILIFNRRDFNSTIASWEFTEVQPKLNELLQENEKLKETLKQNNVAIKRQFNTLANWQEEIMKVHQNHKKKFTETTELINYLKKENTELKMKLSTGTINTEMEYQIINMNQLNNNIKEISIPRTELQESQEFQKLVPLLADELNTCIECRILSDTENLLTTSNIMNSQLEQATTSKSNDSNYLNHCPDCDIYQQFKNTNNCTECEKCIIKDKEISTLKESVVLLKLNLQHATLPAQFCIKSSANQKVQQYIEKLFKLNICFDKQVNHCILIEKYLKEFKEAYENTLNKSDSKIKDHDCRCLSTSRNFHSHQNLRASYKKLIEEQQKFMEGKENAFVLQNEFQEAMLECISIPYELETMLSESIVKNNVTSESIQGAIESKEENTGAKQLLEENSTLLVKERESSEEEKKLFNIQKTNLKKEKPSSDHQSQLSEKLEASKAKLKVQFDQLIDELTIVHENIQNKDFQLKEEQKIVERNQMEAKLMQEQLKVYEEDFEREKSIKESLLAENTKLNLDLQTQVCINKEILRSVTATFD